MAKKINYSLVAKKVLSAGVGGVAGKAIINMVPVGSTMVKSIATVLAGSAAVGMSQGNAMAEGAGQGMIAVAATSIVSSFVPALKDQPAVTGVGYSELDAYAEEQGYTETVNSTDYDEVNGLDEDLDEV